MLGKRQTTEITISNRTLFRIVVVILLTLATVRFFLSISEALRLIFISGFLAIALNPAVTWISHRLRIKSRVWATAIAYISVVIILAAFLALVLPPLIQQSIDFAQSIPLSVEDIHNQNTPIVRFINDNNLTQQYTEIIGDVKSSLQTVTSTAFTTITTVGNTIVAIITVIVLTFMMLVEGPSWIKRILAMQPEHKVKKRKRVLSRMYGMVTGYVNGQLFIATVAACFALVALLIASSIFNVTINAVALAFVVGLIGLIPMIGNTVAAAIVVIVCMFVSLPLALTMLVFFLVYQQIENATLQPYIQSKYNELTPLTVFIAALVGIHFAGFIGALVAIPLAGCLRIYVMEYYGDKLAPKNHEKLDVA